MSELLSRIKAYSTSRPTKIALSSELTQLSYSELQSKIDNLSSSLETINCHSVGIWLDNSVDWAVIQLAAMHLHITVIPIPTFFSSSQIEHLISSTQMDLIIATFEYAEQNTDFQSVDLEFPNAPRCKKLYSCLRTRRGKNEHLLPANTSLITFTSGSTGTPKGVCISDDLIDQMCCSLNSVTQTLDIKKHLSLLPLAVMLENIAGVFLPLFVGEEVTIDASTSTGLTGSSTPDLQTLATYLEKHDFNSLILTPELLKLLILLKQQGLSLEHLKYVAVGGGKVSPALLQHAHALEIPVYEGYGLSECGSVVALNTPDACKPGSAGQPLPHCKINISTQGEIQVQGPKMLGYLDNSLLNDAYIATGDLGYLDDDGFLYITGRRKNVQINSFGRNFSPEWVESEINGLPGVIRSAVYGDDKPFITAVIQMLPTLSHNMLWQRLAHLNETLPDYVQIQHVVQMHDSDIANEELLTPNGRIKRDNIQNFYGPKIEAGYLAEACND
ncbi:MULTISPECIES: AMP-binding protein [unclassified Neptuniibacter]|uniref:AMP-binding protein n=1 Tax=unclassified Neptuniibacter TaxID=2630693 RepID=UPI000C5366F7|nr:MULTISPECIES: AMP-binding protein [unclassified Neptuniibacter]MAY42363.1 long-chain acyl-CoA synthetase [Oceanospirillaceae bacterium]|tara:strand:+ start:12388 stop:13890 length:1503 start_codon:yes stop_codon:yes gene_type:complete